MPTHFRPGVESLERKDLLSAAALPTVTTRTYHAVSLGVIHAVNLLARSGNGDRAEMQLKNLSARLPQGTQELLPRWLDELTGFDPTRRGSTIAIRNRLLRSLDSHVLTGVKFGEFRFVGPGSGRFENTLNGISQNAPGFGLANESNWVIEFGLTPKGGTGGKTLMESLEPRQTLTIDPTIFGRGYTSVSIQVSTNDPDSRFIGNYEVTPPLQGLGLLVTNAPFPRGFQVMIVRYGGDMG